MAISYEAVEVKMVKSSPVWKGYNKLPKADTKRGCIVLIWKVHN